MEKFNILLVDDISENLYTLKLLIEDNFENINIFQALSVKDALIEIMKHDMDLIVSDVQMPESSGFDFAKYLKNIEQTKDIPIILVTGIYDNEKYKKEAFESSSNVVEYITKPIDDELFYSKLKIFIDIFENRKQDKKDLENKNKQIQSQEKMINMLNSVENHFDESIKVNDDYTALNKDENETINIAEILYNVSKKEHKE